MKGNRKFSPIFKQAPPSFYSPSHRACQFSMEQGQGDGKRHNWKALPSRLLRRRTRTTMIEWTRNTYLFGFSPRYQQSAFSLHPVDVDINEYIENYLIPPLFLPVYHPTDRLEYLKRDLEDIPYMVSQRQFFNQELETLPKSRLKALQLERLQSIVERAYTQNQFYRKLYDQAGVKPSDIQSLADIRKLPFLEKKTVREAYPYGMALKPIGGEGGILQMHATSGTTGKSVPVFATQKDIDYWADLNARELWMTGMRPGDVLMNCYGYGLPTGGFGFHYGAMAMGVLAIPMGSDARQYERMRDFILDFGVTALCMTPSVGLYVGNKLADMGVDLRTSKLKIGLFGAEPWPWETRLKLEALFGFTAYDEFGMTEFLGPGMTCECAERNGMHAWADAFLVECIDPATGEPVPEGQDGELVWTWLTADGTAMIRYRSRDLSRTWWEERCSCGRTHPKIAAIKGRSDDAVSIRGLIVFPSQIEAALVQFPETGANFRIIVDKRNGLDTFDLKVEIKDRAMLDHPETVQTVQKQMAEAVKSITGNTPHVQLVPADSLPRATGGESKTASARVEDRRNK